MQQSIFIGRNRIHLHEVDSTNNYLRSLVRDKLPPDGTVVTTDKQTQGRGQRSNVWLSEPGKNLTCSYLLQPKFLHAKHQFSLSCAAALAVFELVSERLPELNVRIKWPNDILVGERKIAGILIENAVQGAFLHSSIIGIGINVNQTRFAEGLPATSFRSVSGKESAVDDVLHQLNILLEKRYLQLKNGGKSSLLSAFNEHLFAVNKQRELKINGVLYTVRVLGVQATGELCLQHADGSVSRHQHYEIGWELR